MQRTWKTISVKWKKCNIPELITTAKVGVAVKFTVIKKEEPKSITQLYTSKTRERTNAELPNGRQ